MQIGALRLAIEIGLPQALVAAEEMTATELAAKCKADTLLVGMWHPPCSGLLLKHVSSGHASPRRHGSGRRNRGRAIQVQRKHGSPRFCNVDRFDQVSVSLPSMCKQSKT